MEFKKITSEDLQGKGVYGLPDTPELSKENMQAKFDELSKDVIIPAFNQMVDDITTAFGGVYTKEQVKEYVAGIMVEAGTGDMVKAVYDTDDDGTVDNAAKLGGQTPDYYATAEAVNELTQSISAIVVVDALPENPDANTLYLIPKG